MAGWEVFALRYAVHERRAFENFIRAPDPHDAPMPMDYFVWVVRRGGRVVVVDTGFTPEGGAKRGRTLIRPVEAALRQLGVDPWAVEDVVITHLHYDHAGNLDLFPQARFHLQEAEMGFATGRHMCQACIRYPFDVEDVVRMVRAVYAERRDILVQLVRQHLADFVEPRVPVGGMQMPCVFIRDIPESRAVESAQRAGIDLLGLTALHASRRHKAGFLMGFAAYAPHELEIAVKKLASVLHALCRRSP